ncbi:hypothetical protein KY313_01835 [Candidatus Woesearchaeota archaeon]|jgi:choline kinase|nr:hypothetical protein [Candidatus Woesearchaeota archaeon]
MSLDYNIEKLCNDIKYQVKVTGKYLTSIGKEFLRHEYEDMGIKFIDENYSKKQKD